VDAGMNGYATEIGIISMDVDMDNVLEKLTNVIKVIHGLNGLVKVKNKVVRSWINIIF
jgi:hypothetical protein